MLWRVLVVDDEPRQRKGLARLVLALRPGWQVLEAGNGQEALALARRERPHAVISDIRMPIMNGLVLVEQLKQEQPDIVPAYISAYQDFSYAAQALRLGAVEYLVKPYTKEQAEQLLIGLERRMKANHHQDALSTRLDETLRAWRDRHVLALVSRPLSAEEAGEISSFLPVGGAGHVAVLRLLVDEEGEWAGEDLAEMLPQLRAWIETEFPSIYAAEQGGEQLGFVCILPDQALPGEEIESRLCALADSLAEDFGVDLVIALSARAEVLKEQAQQAFRQASAAAGYRFYQKSARFIPYRQVRDAQERDLPYLFRYEQSLRQAVQAQDPKAAADRADAFLDFLQKGEVCAPEKLIRRVYQVAQSMVLSIEARLPGPVFDQLWADCAAVFSQCHSFDALRDSFSRLMQAAVAVQMMDQGLRNEAHVRDVIDHIKKHIVQPLTLGELAEQFYFSPNYLSAMIKSRTGYPFKPYVQKLRMDEAARLLTCGDDKVAEVAHKVGIPDPAYFNRLFKKAFGVPPDVYRRNTKPGSNCRVDV